MQRRRFLTLMGGAAALGLGGCVTSSLVEDIHRTRYRTYQEKISYFLMSQDRQKLVVLGEQFHYVLTVPTTLGIALAAPFHAQLSASFGDFRVDTDGRVRGGCRLVLATEASDEDKAAALAAGFRKGRDGVIYSDQSVQGQRYAIGNFTVPDTVQRLNRDYAIRVDEAQPRGAQVLKYALTPVTLAADGVLVILSIPLIPVALIALRNVRWI